MRASAMWLLLLLIGCQPPAVNNELEHKECKDKLHLLKKKVRELEEENFQLKNALALEDMWRAEREKK